MIAVFSFYGDVLFPEEYFGYSDFMYDYANAVTKSSRYQNLISENCRLV